MPCTIASDQCDSECSCMHVLLNILDDAGKKSCNMLFEKHQVFQLSKGAKEIVPTNPEVAGPPGRKKHRIGLHEQETIVSGCFRPMLLLHTKNCILSSTHHRDLHTSHIPSEQVSIFGVNVAFSGQSQKCKCPFLHQYQTRIPPSGVPRVDSVAILLYLQRFNS